MNYFGMFFSFMLPGVILGGMGAVAIHQELQASQTQKSPQSAQAS